MLGDALVPILAAINIFAMVYVPIDYRRWREQQKIVDYDELERMIEEYRAGLRQDCGPDTNKPTDKKIKHR